MSSVAFDFLEWLRANLSGMEDCHAPPNPHLDFSGP